MKLRVGIFGEANTGWELLLEQEGIPFSYMREDSDYDYSVVVVSGHFDGPPRFIGEYLRKGGAVLCSGEHLALISGKPSARKFVRNVLPEGVPPWTGIGLLDIDTHLQIPANVNFLRTNDGAAAGFSGEYGGGYVVALPFDAGSVVLDDRTKTKSFYATRTRLPFESVSLVNKSVLRKLVARSLEFLHHSRSLPYVHKWYYPDGQSSLFMFRIDTDNGSKESIEKLYSLCEWNAIPATWFIDVKSQEGYLDCFRRMSNHELGIHCYEHETYDDFESNRRNIAKAQVVLDRAGLNVKGIAAPFGKWNTGIRDAIKSFGFEYSSEFSYDYDNLPSFPKMVNDVPSVLQVPVHPISIGSLKRQGFSRDEMIAYFRSVAAQKESAHDPMFFYHHPNDRNGEVVTALFEYAIERKLQSLTMLEYARWWKRRTLLNFSAEYEQGIIVVNPAVNESDIFVRVTNSNGKEAFLQPKGSVQESSLKWNDKPAVVPLPDDIQRTAKFNPWVPLIRFEDSLHKKM